MLKFITSLLYQALLALVRKYEQMTTKTSHSVHTALSFSANIHTPTKPQFVHNAVLTTRDFDVMSTLWDRIQKRKVATELRAA